MTQLPKKSKNYSQGLDTFFASLLFCIVIPLTPVLVSIIYDKLHYNEMVLTAAVYPVSLFIQSKSRFLFSSGIVILIFYSLCLSNREENMHVFQYAQLTILVVAGTHLIERFRLHIIQKEKFFNFK